MGLNDYFDYLSSTGHIVVVTDFQLEYPGPHILWVSKSFEELTGYTLEELKGKTPRLLQGAETERKTLDSLKEKLKNQEVFEGQITNYKKNGEKFCKAWRIMPIECRGIPYYLSVHDIVHEYDVYQSVIDGIKKKQESILENLNRINKMLDVGMGRV